MALLGEEVDTIMNQGAIAAWCVRGEKTEVDASLTCPPAECSSRGFWCANVLIGISQ